jgi:glucose/mannose-6-phosphate isomerase
MKLNSTTIRDIDPQGMQDLILAFPEQLEHAIQISRTTGLSLDGGDIRNICVMGMGGSAIGGDIVRCYLNPVLTIPLVVNRFYAAPDFVNADSLVLVSSYSGDTEETIAGYQDAIRRKARIVCTASGGRVKELAAQHGHPIFTIPGGAPPRSALGYLAVPILFALHAADLIADPEPDLREAIAVLTTLRDELHPDVAENPAAQMAGRLHGKIPLIYAAVQPMEAVAMRWKGQLSENSKVMAFCNVFPELNHNEIVGWGPRHELSKTFQVIYLRDGQDHDRVKRRMSITKRVIERHAGAVLEVASRGSGLLARMFSLLFFGDLVSLYLATLNGVNPTSIDNIDYLKAQLSS